MYSLDEQMWMILGYIVVGILAFLLGISVTLLGLHLREKQDREEEQGKR